MENQLCDIPRNMSASANFGRRLEVSSPIFDGSENEDVFEFFGKFKRAAKLNGWNDDDLPIGLPLYLKGHAVFEGTWFKCPGGTPLFGLYGDVPLDRVWFFGLAVLNRVYNLTCFCPKQGQNLS